VLIVQIIDGRNQAITLRAEIVSEMTNFITYPRDDSPCYLFALWFLKRNVHRTVSVRIAVLGDVDPLVIVGNTRTLRAWVYRQLGRRVTA
jgi:hypothetical protein